MSERINVDHAFDPEARQAQSELDAYMASRPYKDINGSIHNPDDGKFANYDDYLESKRQDHYAETLETGDYSSESLEDLAKHVAQARLDGDKTRANDAEEAFFNKFAAYSEKYDWEDDDSAAETSSVNHKDIRDSKAGRSTIDDRLERYSKIMYGSEDSSVSTVGPTPEAATIDDHETSANRKSQKATYDEFDQNDMEELNKILVEEDEKANYVPKHRADNRDEDSPIFDQLKEERGESDEAAREGESLEEYDARQSTKNGGSHRLEKASTEGLDLSDIPSSTTLNRVSAEGLDINDAPAVAGEVQAAAKLSWRDRLHRLMTPSSLAAELSSGWYYSKEKLGKHKKATIALGILAVGGVVTAVYLNRDTGGSPNPSGHGNPFNDLYDNFGDKPTKPGSGQGGNELLNSNAWNIPKGSGGEALMERLGADKSTWYQHQNDFLSQFPSEAYRMSDGNVGFDDPGRLSNGAIKFWSKFATK